MAQRLPSQVIADLEAAGLTPSAAETMTAIAGGESGWNDTDLGDLGLQDAQWGPSFGLYQIRTRKDETGKGTYRDIQWLAQSDAHQAQAAVAISKGGSDFTPWTVYNTGAYRSFLGQAHQAAGQASTTAAAGDLPGPGPWWMPWNLPSAALSNVEKQALGGARSILVEALAVGLGLALVGFGIVRLVAPTAGRVARREYRRNEEYARQGASTAAAVL